MEQHAIPQQISSYQFRLVGDMTLKQFFQLAAGCLMALLIYTTNLYPIIKWPLMAIFALIGVALAFLPFEERPLDKWVLAFFKSIYSPTIFKWRHGSSKVFFKDNANLPADDVIAPQGKEALAAYLKTPFRNQTNETNKLEKNEQTLLSRIAQVFTHSPTPPKAVQTQTPVSQVQMPQANAVQSGNFTQQNPQVKRIVTEVADIKTPETKPVYVEKGAKQQIVQNQTAVKKTTTSETSVSPVLEEKEKVSSLQAQFSPEAAPPNPPIRENTITGQTLDPDGKIVEGAILEIRDIAGRPVRALKTNKLGHFLVVTPLQNGKYEIVTEKEGCVFDPVSFEAKGDFIPPIAVKARSKLVS